LGYKIYWKMLYIYRENCKSHFQLENKSKTKTNAIIYSKNSYVHSYWLHYTCARRLTAAV
jgi:hypothetical protein